VPSASSDQGYFPQSSVDFILAVPARKLLSGSIRIEGTVSVLKGNGDPVARADKPHIDSFVGAHCFFDQLSTEVESKGMLETLANYPRMVSQMSKASLSQDDTCSLMMGAELRSGGKQANGMYALQAVAERSNTGSDAQNAAIVAAAAPASFSIKPMMCFNRSQGGMLSFDKQGFVRISCILSSSLDALFGKDSSGAGCTYLLKDLACRFVTVPDDGDMSPQLMRSYVSTVNSVQSTASSIISRVPSARVNGVSVSFVKQADENDADKNSLALQSLPSYVSAEYLFANSTNQNVTYVIRDRGDAVQRGIDALTDSGHSNVSVTTLAANDGFLVGLPFSEFLDLSQQLFSMRLNVNSTSITTNPLNAYSVFSTLIEL
jgi:hypothetical protein